MLHARRERGRGLDATGKGTAGVQVEAKTAAETEARRVVDTYGDDILRLAYTYLRSRADAEDVCQDVLVKLLSRGKSFDTADHERAWVIRCTVNACKDVLKGAGRRMSVPIEAAGDPIDPTAWENGEPLDTTKPAVSASDEAPGPVTAAVLALPMVYREAIHLHYYEGLPIKQAAELADISTDAMTKRLSRARALLREKLGDDYDDLD